MASNKPNVQGTNTNGPIKVANLWKSNAPAVTVCNWSDVAHDVLGSAVDTITRAGGAIMLGLTSDGGAFSICVLQGDQKIKEYPHGATEAEAVLKALAEYFLDEIL